MALPKLDMDSVMETFRLAEKIKARMQKLGKRRVRVACPKHEGKYITAVLAGRKDHIHMACEVGDCNRLME